MAGGRPIEIPITVDADGAEKGVSKVADAFDEVEDSLKDLAKAGDKASDSLEDDMSDAAKKIDRDLTKALESVQDEAKASAKSIGKNVKDGTDKAGEGFDELKDESKSTAKEAAASFGSIEDAAGALQEVAANAFSGFGPAGVAAGIVAAAGIGLAMSALTDHAEKVNENKEKMLDLAQTIRDNGGVLRQSDYIQAMEDYSYAIQDSKEWFEIFQEDAVSGFEKIKKISDETGVSTKQIFKGAFGDLKSSQTELDAVNRKIQELKDKRDALFNTEGAVLDPVDATTLSSLESYRGLIEDNVRKQQGAIETEKLRKQAIEGTTQAVKEDIEALELHTDAVKGSISSELDYLDGVDNLTEKLTTNGATLDKNTAKGRENQRAVLDQASAIEQVAKDSIDAGGEIGAVTKKFEAQKDALITQVMPAFGGSRDKARAYIDTILATPKSVSTAVRVTGIAEAEAQVRAFTNTGRHIQVNFQTGSTYSVDNYIQGMVRGVTVPVDFAARGKPAIN